MDERVESTSGSSGAGREARRGAASSAALVVLAVLALGAAAWIGRAVLAPLAIAVVLSLLLTPLVRLLGRARVPAPVGAALTLASCLGVATWGVWTLAEPAADWLEELPASLEKVGERLAEMRRPIDTVNEAAKQVEKITEPEQAAGLSVKLDQPDGAAGSWVLGNVRALLASAFLVVVLAYFLLADEDSFLRSVVRILPRLEDKKFAVLVVRDIERQISRYLVTITTINLALGAVVAACMLAAGMPSPFLWGAMAAALNYVPYVGAAVGVATVGLVSFLTFESSGAALLPPLLYGAATGVEGMLVTPSILGRRFQLRPVILFVWLMVLGGLWGMAGALLAVPLLVMVKILCDNLPRLAPLGELLGRDADTWRLRRQRAREAEAEEAAAAAARAAGGLHKDPAARAAAAPAGPAGAAAGRWHES